VVEGGFVVVVVFELDLLLLPLLQAASAITATKPLMTSTRRPIMRDPLVVD
jgi:hypothetical protein